VFRRPHRARARRAAASIVGSASAPGAPASRGRKGPQPNSLCGALVCLVTRIQSTRTGRVTQGSVHVPEDKVGARVVGRPAGSVRGAGRARRVRLLYLLLYRTRLAHSVGGAGRGAVAWGLNASGPCHPASTPSRIVACCLQVCLGFWGHTDFHWSEPADIWRARQRREGGAGTGSDSKGAVCAWIQREQLLLPLNKAIDSSDAHRLGCATMSKGCWAEVDQVEGFEETNSSRRLEHRPEAPGGKCSCDAPTGQRLTRRRGEGRTPDNDQTQAGTEPTRTSRGWGRSGDR
jgi:hypothetical protein